jgi:hypothetical protein
MGPVGRASAWVGRRCAHSVPNGESLYIDAGKPVGAQQYNRFDGRFQALKSLSTIRNFTFDTHKTRPYKRGSHGERGVPKTSRVIAAKGFATQTVPSSAKGLDQNAQAGWSCALCIVCLERDTPAAADVCAFRSAKVSAVASSKARPHGFAQKGRAVISDGISPFLRGGHVKLESLILAQNERWRQA